MREDNLINWCMGDHPCRVRLLKAPQVGLEPTTLGLENRCSIPAELLEEKRTGEFASREGNELDWQKDRARRSHPRAAALIRAIQTW